MESELGVVKDTVIRIEIEHGKQLAALSDGYKMLHDKVEWIEVDIML